MLGTGRALRAFPFHAHDIKHRPCGSRDRSLWASERAGPARPGDAAASDRAAIPATRRCRLRLAGPPEPCHCARWHDHRPVAGTARRQIGKIGRRALPAIRRRPRNACPRAEHGRQNACYPATRQPRRRPECEAEIGVLRIPQTPSCPGFCEEFGPKSADLSPSGLVAPKLSRMRGRRRIDFPPPPSLYAARSRDRRYSPPRSLWRGSSAG